VELIASYTLVVFVGYLFWAAVSDMRTRRIPNALTASGLLLALTLKLPVGSGALMEGLLGAALAFAVMLPLFAVRGVGGGDVKLLIMVGAFLGPNGFLVALAATALAGGVLSLAVVMRRGVLLPVLYNTGGLAKWVFTAGRGGERATLASTGAVSVPYGVAIAAGSLVALYLGGLG
jgi:prepilin peptidase CpaA